MLDPSILILPSGCSVDLAKPHESHFDLNDIARGLSNICRYGGQLPLFYSVAQHSVLVSRLCEQVATPGVKKPMAIWGLLHDASEAYIGDVIWPLKRMNEMSSYREVEYAIMEEIVKQFRLFPNDQPKLVGWADRCVMMAEARDLRKDLYGDIIQARVFTGTETPWPNELIDPVYPLQARELFLERCAELGLTTDSAGGRGGCRAVGPR